MMAKKVKPKDKTISVRIDLEIYDLLHESKRIAALKLDKELSLRKWLTLVVPAGVAKLGYEPKPKPKK